MLSIGRKTSVVEKEQDLSISGLAKKNTYLSKCGIAKWKWEVYCNFLSILQVLDYHEVERKEFFNHYSNGLSANFKIY